MANRKKASEQVQSGEHVSWGYSGKLAPEHWADLCPSYALARNGERQSPIDITEPVSQSLPPLTFSYRPIPLKILNNGLTLRVDCDKLCKIQIADTTYHLVQFHFHVPSEHTVDGKQADMEAHFVHRAADGTLAVVGVLLRKGNHNGVYDRLCNLLPTKPGEVREDERHDIDLLELLPNDHAYFQYPGSLTTPPCTENVNWLVLTDPVEISSDQFQLFRKLINNTARPVQPLNGRTILCSRLND